MGRPSSTRPVRASPKCWSTEHGFNVVAVEADWPDAAVYDAYVRGLPRPMVPKTAFTRFPTWMWRNGQVAEFLNRLKEINSHDRRSRSKGGLLRAGYLQPRRLDRGGARLSRQGRSPNRARSRGSVMVALAPWRAEPVRYGRMALSRGYAVCEKPVTEALLDLLRKRLDYLVKDGEAFFDAEQNARIVAAAEHYYRVMYYGDAASWNLRDQHMFDTLERVCFPIAGPTPRRWCGRTTRISAMPSSPRWARSGVSTISGSSRASLRRAGGADRLRHRPRHGRRGV